MNGGSVPTSEMADIGGVSAEAARASLWNRSSVCGDTATPAILYPRSPNPYSLPPAVFALFGGSMLKVRPVNIISSQV